MKNKLSDILDRKKIFKLVLGLGNQDLESIDSLVQIYAKSGADMFDINPSEKSVKRVFSAIKKAGKNIEDFSYSISFGLSGDTHIQKCIIDEKKCKKCFKCIKKCPQNAIFEGNGHVKVATEKCIGCKKCDDCKAISFCDNNIAVENVVAIAEKYKIDCIEIHLSTKKIPDEEIKYVLKNFGGMLSVCLDRKFYSNERLKKLINKIVKWNKSSNFIIQADGVPMSGAEDSYKSTLQAVAMAQLVEKYGTYILMSGGTNSKTADLAQMCGIRYNGISVGSFARKIVKGCNLDEALCVAKKLVAMCKK